MNKRSLALVFAASLLIAHDRAAAQPPGFGGFGGPGRGGPGLMLRMPPVLTALDTNEDGEISMQEIAAGATTLLQLDENGDGELAGEELWPDLGGPGGFGRGGAPGGFGGGGRGTRSMMRMMPWMIALDTDKDDAISKAEIARCAAALKPLDKDNNGKLTENELRPDFLGERGGAVERLDPDELDFHDGVAMIPNHATFQKLSYKGEEVMIDTFLADLEFVKFTIDLAASSGPALYFINTVTHRAHMMFARAAGLPRGGIEQMKGVLVYRPRLMSPGGTPGLYTFEFEPFDQYPFEMVKIAQDLLVEKMPILKGKIGYYPRQRGVASYQEDKALYDSSDVRVYLEQDLVDTEVAFLPLNLATTFGRLRLMDVDQRPGPRDVVIYRSLPNELPRVAGIITEIRQTPLSHVNLRAIQDKVPNAFVAGAADSESVKPLIGKYVFYNVTADGYELRQATAAEVASHFAKLRPSRPQTPPRDLSVTEIRPLNQIHFEDSASFGVKAANLATMHTFDFPEGTVPHGFSVPFYFYDEFMKHNGFYELVDALLKNPEFQQDRNLQQKELKKLRSLVKKGKLPGWTMQQLADVQQAFPAGTSIRCRSSTNNEDLPGFSGAGLYDSYTHHPEEGHLAKSIKQVFASLWNFRAFEEREFYRIDHKAAAMGVLLHPNYSDEKANGVAVTDDILYETQGNYYLNAQIGEDLVTNPQDQSIPEETLLGWWKDDGYQVMRRSNRSLAGAHLLGEQHLDQLRDRLARIHGRFRRLYGHSEDDRFAMEIEFKITKENELAIKQARPWVFSSQQ